MGKHELLAQGRAEGLRFHGSPPKSDLQAAWPEEQWEEERATSRNVYNLLQKRDTEAAHPALLAVAGYYTAKACGNMRGTVLTPVV